MSQRTFLARRPDRQDRGPALTPRWHAAVLALLLPAGILTVDPDGWSPFGPAKWAAVLAVLGLGAAAATFARVRVARAAGLAWVAFLAWVAITAANGLDARYAWLGTPERHFGALTWGLCAVAFVLGHTLDGEREGRLVVGAAAFAAGVAGAWALAEELGWTPVALAGNDRLVGSSGNADYLGATMALLVPLAAGVALDRSWSRWWRGAAGVSAALGVVALVGSGARGAWLGTLVALFLALRLAWRCVGPRLSARPARAATAVGAGAALLVGLSFALGVAGRVPGTFEAGTAGGSSRLAEWRVAAAVVAAHPVLGTGPEGYRIAFGAAVDPAYQREYGRSPLPDRAHDVVLDVAATLGVPGALLYLLVVALAGGGLWRFARRGPPAWLVGTVLGLVAYALGELTLFPIAELEPGVWLLVGLVTVRATGPDRLAELRLRRLLPRLLAVAALGLAGLALGFGVRDVRADRDVKAALSELSAGRQHDAQADATAAVALDPDDIAVRLAAAEVDGAPGTGAALRAALAQDDAALAVSPADPVARQDRAQVLVERAQLTESAGSWRLASADLADLVRSDPLNPQVLLDLGVTEAALRRDAAAAQTWVQAAALAPHSAAPWTDLAVMYLGGGRQAAARRAAHEALRRDPGDSRAEAVLARTSDPAGRTQPGEGT